MSFSAASKKSELAKHCERLQPAWDKVPPALDLKRACENSPGRTEKLGSEKNKPGKSKPFKRTWVSLKVKKLGGFFVCF